jgi:N-methylhydantoinase B
MVDCCFGALAMLVPDRVFAACDGGNTGITIGGWDHNRRPFIYVDFIAGSWGGRPWADGIDGNANMFANMSSQSAEILETEQPLEVLAYSFIPDAAGAGKFRGGSPYRREYRLTEEEAVLQVRADRNTHRPYGLYGGYPGAPSRNTLNPGPDEVALPPKLTRAMRRGEVFRHDLPGSGGWGDPLERDLALVQRDVRNELLSVVNARRLYGVVLSADGVGVDAAATAALREMMRAGRGWREPPSVLRDEPDIATEPAP